MAIQTSDAISEWKNKAISLILSNDEVVDCLELNELEQEEPVYTRIFPYNHVPVTQEETKVYITVSVSIPKITFNKVWAFPKMTIRIISHQDKMKISKAGVSATRIDYISNLISRMMIGRSDFGYGKLQLASDWEDMYNFSYHYRELVFIGEELVETQCGDDDYV